MLLLNYLANILYCQVYELGHKLYLDKVFLNSHTQST